MVAVRYEQWDLKGVMIISFLCIRLVNLGLSNLQGSIYTIVHSSTNISDASTA